MPFPLDTAAVTHGIQLAVAPVFLLTAVSGMIGAVAGRLARIIDRPHTIAELELGGIALPTAPISQKQTSGDISILRGDVTVQTGIHILYRWNRDFAALSAELIDFLHDRGVITVGIDTPSIDLPDSKDLPAHKAVLRHDMTILEGLVLKDVPEGTYELIALPLPLVGFDASPVRAVLRTIKSDK